MNWGEKLCKVYVRRAASLFFFDEYGLIGHQINSYNAFINEWTREGFDSFGEVRLLSTGYDISEQKDGEWRHASVRLGKVALNRPSFWGGTSSDAEHNMVFRHARLQNMTYLVRIKIHVNVQGWTVSYNSEVKRNKLIVRLMELTKLEYIKGEKKDLCVLNSRRHKARFLGYMVKCLLEAYTGHRKCDNRDSFRNKRFELVSELLERELKVHVSHALRILRPLIVVENLDKIKAFKWGNYIFASLRDKGIIEFIGTEEEEDCCTTWGIRFLLEDIAGKQSMKYTHCELDMSFLLVLPKPELLNGQNAIVAVNVHLGYNQEDSWVMKHASLRCGMFRSEHIRSYKAEVDNKELTDKRRKSEDSITFGKIQSKIGRIDNLDNDGSSFIGANMQSGDIVIGKCAESGTDHRVKLKHTGKVHGPESGIVI
ncbi:DNA-DIRECTED RNA polymerase D SUBUNIT 2B-RELATED [Salix purpurea]|uniref:DNA-directed RNA polymerase n=1 Tax=Salix purpurea TaxID=77065 RepID=A0A9Q0V1G7_SALPP|nr:DNA-DIRECTED RNA polymerase D SUBUNIT 2B-RELATED [Salix purpurea]